MDKFINDFDFFWGMIENGKNFSFSRYADGEVMLMRGITVSDNTQAFQIDKWKAPNGMTKLGYDLLDTLNHTENNYYYAISGKNDSQSDYEFLRNNIKHVENNITFVNLWINANYRRSMKKYGNLKRDVILISNEKAKKENFPFNVIDINAFPNNCVDFWEVNSDEYVRNLIEKYGNLENQLFFVSCGPVSEVIIHNLYVNNPNNTYVDVGSSIDEFVHGRVTRAYMDPTSQYSKLISHF